MGEPGRRDPGQVTEGPENGLELQPVEILVVKPAAPETHVGSLPKYQIPESRPNPHAPQSQVLVSEDPGGPSAGLGLFLRDCKPSLPGPNTCVLGQQGLGEDRVCPKDKPVLGCWRGPVGDPSGHPDALQQWEWGEEQIPEVLGRQEDSHTPHCGARQPTRATTSSVLVRQPHSWSAPSGTRGLSHP